MELNLRKLEQVAERTAAPAQALETWEEFQKEFGGTSPLHSPIRSEAFLKVVGNSNFLCRWARRNPQTVREILESDFLQAYSVQDYLHEMTRELQTPRPHDPEAWSEFLLGFKYRHLFRITCQDLGFGHPLEPIMAQLSDLAFAVTQTSLHTLESSLERSAGLPVTTGHMAEPIPFTVMAMGKLGGGELNFSSDLDLIYFYGTDQGKMTGRDVPSSLTPHEYFVKLGQQLTNFLNKKTANGFLYRIDLDLRPEGKAGVLANSLDAMEEYYENFGAPWERQALIKAGLAAGSAPLFHAFQSKVQPFVFPKTSDFSILKNLGEMKAKIVASIRATGHPRNHVKLGDGGIREVEFFVQSLQLLFGGNHPELQTANNLEALRRLADLGLISWEEETRLRQAYVFLRTLEHRLQLAEEQQTHLIPPGPEERTQLARRMGYTEADSKVAVERMSADLDAHQDFVQKTFQELLSHRFEESG